MVFGFSGRPAFGGRAAGVNANVVFLVVEDAAPAARVAGRVLERFGPTLVATTVAEALERLDGIDGSWALVVDVGLPDGSGFDVIAAARAQYGDVLCLVLTAADDRDTIAMAQLHGAEYLTKPAQRANLEAFAERACAPARHRHVRLGRLVSELATEHGLSSREAQIVRLVASGVAVGDLPGELGVTDNTVKTLTRRLLRKCGAQRLADVSGPLQRRVLRDLRSAPPPPPSRARS